MTDAKFGCMSCAADPPSTIRPRCLLPRSPELSPNTERSPQAARQDAEQRSQLDRRRSSMLTSSSGVRRSLRVGFGAYKHDISCAAAAANAKRGGPDTYCLLPPDCDDPACPNQLHEQLPANLLDDHRLDPPWTRPCVRKSRYPVGIGARGFDQSVRPIRTLGAQPGTTRRVPFQRKHASSE